MVNHWREMTNTAKTIAVTVASVAVTLVCIALLKTYVEFNRPVPPAEPTLTQAEVQKFCGWNEATAEEEWKRVSREYKDRFVPFVIWDANANLPAVSQDKRAVLWDATIKVTGKHLPNVAQQIGDCVSWGMKHACEYLLCVQIATANLTPDLALADPRGPPQEFHEVFAPHIYGISRVQIGKSRLGCNSDGSNGSWAAAGVMEYGVIPADAKDVPPYSGSVAKKWGCKPGPPDQFLKLGKEYLVESAAQVTTWEEARDALINGYPVTVASNRGFTMRGKVKDGKLWLSPSGSWAHQMCIVGYDPSPEPCFCILNSWGPNAHGEQPDGPPGSFWTTANVVQSMVKQGDSFAISGQKGFPSNDNWDLDILRKGARHERAIDALNAGVGKPVRSDFAVSF